MVNRKKRIISALNKKGAMELSMSTIVILVIAMAMLVGGLVLVRIIYTGAEDAIGGINKGVEDEIDKLFTNSDAKIAIYPSSRKIEIKQNTPGKGFAFSVRNTGIEDREFIYDVYVDTNFDIRDKCGIQAKEADDWLDIASGSFSLGKGAKLDLPELVLFTIPDNAPPCTIPYRIDIKERAGDIYTTGKIFLTIQSR